VAEANRKLRILLTNDDGVQAPGLKAAYEALSGLGEVTVVAPANQRSGVSHTVTIEGPLRARPLETFPGYMVDFTPVDAVKLALKHLLTAPPDLVVSGINRGTNAGYLVHYSGTVAAAKEAVMCGVQAIAISLCWMRSPDFTTSGHVARLVVQRVLERPLPPGVVLNVNVPRGSWGELKGFRWCRQSLEPLQDDYDRREDPRRRPYFWLAGAGRLRGQAPDDDLTAIEDGYVSLTPLTVDWTHPLYGDADRDWLAGLGIENGNANEPGSVTSEERSG
jgi:5'-nucleotidase